MALFGITLLAAGQSQRTRKPAAALQAHAPVAPAVPVEAVVPFRGGEKLSFRVMWSKFSVNAGTVEFLVAQHGNFFGHPAWHFQARAQTVDTMRLVYPLDDQFDSYTEAVKLASLQYEMYLHEQGKQQNNSWRMIADGGPAPSDATAARVCPARAIPLGCSTRCARRIGRARRSFARRFSTATTCMTWTRDWAGGGTRDGAGRRSSSVPRGRAAVRARPRGAATRISPCGSRRTRPHARADRSEHPVGTARVELTSH